MSKDIKNSVQNTLDKYGFSDIQVVPKGKYFESKSIRTLSLSTLTNLSRCVLDNAKNIGVSVFDSNNQLNFAPILPDSVISVLIYNVICNGSNKLFVDGYFDKEYKGLLDLADPDKNKDFKPKPYVFNDVQIKGTKFKDFTESLLSGMNYLESRGSVTSHILLNKKSLTFLLDEDDSWLDVIDLISEAGLLNTRSNPFVGFIYGASILLDPDIEPGVVRVANFPFSKGSTEVYSNYITFMSFLKSEGYIL